MDNMQIQKQAFHHTPRGIRDIGCSRLRLEAEAGRGRFHVPRSEETEQQIF
jgi:hypothetical protein